MSIYIIQQLTDRAKTVYNQYLIEENRTSGWDGDRVFALEKQVRAINNKLNTDYNLKLVYDHKIGKITGYTQCIIEE